MKKILLSILALITISIVPSTAFSFDKNECYNDCRPACYSPKKQKWEECEIGCKKGCDNGKSPFSGKVIKVEEDVKISVKKLGFDVEKCYGDCPSSCIDAQNMSICTSKCDFNCSKGIYPKTSKSNSNDIEEASNEETMSKKDKRKAKRAAKKDNKDTDKAKKNDKKEAYKKCLSGEKTKRGCSSLKGKDKRECKRNSKTHCRSKK